MIWSVRGAVTGVQDVATDATLREKIAVVGGMLRLQYGVEGSFRRVDHPEPYYRNDERVYRCGGITLIARPFTIDAPEV